MALLDAFALGWMRTFVSVWARPRILPEDFKDKLRARERPICYVLELNGVADLTVLERICREHGLPRPSQSLRGPLLGSRSVVCLERRRGVFANRIDRRIPDNLRSLVRNALVAQNADIDFVPVNFFWGRAPDKERSWLRLWFSETWDITGRFRRTLTVVVNGRNLLAQFGEPISLRAAAGDGADVSRSVRRVARALRASLRKQRTATIGPDYSHRRTIVTQVLRTGAVRAAIRGEMKAKNLNRHDALMLAKRYADEIAANYSHVFVQFLWRALGRVWNRLYDGVELHHVDRLQALVDDHEIVYVPCHRSHMDYLLLSYVIYAQGYAIPHIAAGLNLNMPVVGRFLRKGGAFFLRRSFGGNTLYTMVFMKYLGLMMARGHSIEYFVEGGRSRTGRLLQPKTGMLAMTLRSFLRDPRRPLVFVPVYFGYERLVEGKTYINELSGKPKEKESLKGMLKTLPALRSRFGKVHVSLGEPIRLANILDDYAAGWRETTFDDDARPAWVGRAVDALATQIMTNINSAACVTPMNLSALVLLAMPKQSMIESDLARQLELYASIMRQSPYSHSVSVTMEDGASMIRYAEAMGVLLRRKHAMGDVLQMTEENSVLMTYFRNNVLHLLAMPSIMACCFLNNRTMRTEDIQRLAWRIYPYVRDELFLRWSEAELPSIVNETLQGLANHGLLEAIDAGAAWARPATGSAEAVQLSILAQCTVPIVERYYLAISLLLKAGSGRMSQDVLESQCQLMAQRMSLLYELNSPEFFDKSLFKNFIDLLRARNVLGVNSEGRLTFTEMLLAVSADAQLVLHEQIRNSILQVTHH